MIRTTSNSMYRSLQAAMAQTRSSLDTYYLQAATGKKMSEASDNPAAVGTIHNVRSQLALNDRYIENIEQAQDGMDSVDGYLATADDVLQRTQEIAIAANNGGLSPTDLDTYAAEVATLKQQMVDLANAQVDGRYLFAGFRDNQPPFGGEPVVYSGTSDVKYVESGPGETVATNIPGDDLFVDPQDVFAVFDTLEAALRSGDTGLISAQLDPVQQATEQVRGQRSLLGNNNARLDDSITLLGESQLQLQSTLSRYEDADLTEVLTEMTQAEQALEAALGVTSRVNSLSLLDFL